MGTIRYVKEDYLKGSIFDSLNKKVKIRLSNKNLTTSELITEPDPEHSYPHVIFLDQVLDSEVNYTLLYNAKVGTIIPIKESDKSNNSDKKYSNKKDNERERDIYKKEYEERKKKKDKKR